MANSEKDKVVATKPARDKELTWLESILLRYRLTMHIAVHTFLFALALLLGYLVWFDAGPAGPERKAWFLNSYLPCLPFFVLIKLIIFGQMRMFRSGWQYAGIRDISRILLGSWYFVAITVTFLFLFIWAPNWLNKSRPPVVGPYFAMFPKGVLVLDFLASVFLVCTARLGFRLYREELRPISAEGVRRVLIVGAGNAAENVIREIHRMRVERYRVIGLVDDDPTKKDILIHGVPVMGQTKDLRRICEEENVEEIIIVMPSASQKELRRVIELCSGTKLKFQSLPGVGDLIDGRVTVSQIRPVDINDLLSRKAVELDSQALGRFLCSRRVLITGAGGSIGSEMCRQICNYQPAQLILLEQAETPLFEIENELRASHPEIPILACICDIYDRQRVMQVWELHQPEVVIHAAAHKHVPLMERNPCEAIKNNILGTKNVADASCQFDAKEFVMISTDKAV
ncbi:MAG: polysaccharide biosynthesis protein, partial [Phycisphaerae bacterium]|nr:polysaccharide biosynthesis protein [Phycisphaerae bacterium]